MAKESVGLQDTKKHNITPVDNENLPSQNDSWKYSSEVESDSTPDKAGDSFEDINWSASEFIAHHKNISWYAVLALITLALSAVVYVLTRDKISTAIIILAAVIFGIYAARKPRLLSYKLDSSGLTIQAKLFDYASFKSFVVVENSILPNIILMPLKRFMPSLSIYLDPTTKEEVVKVLGERLPQDFRQQDFVERFMQRIRF